MTGEVVLEAARRRHLRNAAFCAGLVVSFVIVYPMTATSTLSWAPLARLLLPFLAAFMGLWAIGELKFAVLARPMLRADADQITLQRWILHVTLPREEVTGIGPPGAEWGGSFTVRTRDRKYWVYEEVDEVRYARLRAQLLELGYPAI